MTGRSAAMILIYACVAAILRRKRAGAVGARDLPAAPAALVALNLLPGWTTIPVAVAGQARV